MNSASTASSQNTPPPTDFLASYQVTTGYDEMCLSNGQLRPHWEYLIRSFNDLGINELDKRWQEARRLLRDNGVTYNINGDPQGSDRPWQLDPLPLLISSEEWITIERGLIQRAELLNLLLADLYGDREVFRKGILPIEMIYTHPGFLRPCVGLHIHERHRLPIYAVDLVRAPDGSIWAVADRTQTPSGAGYALENRLVLSRILPSLFRDSHVHRVALFFRTLRLTLASMSHHDDPRIVVLTPGAHTTAYFEHAYLAKYLGYTLVQGADLTVRDGQTCLKTLDGLQPINVILRRVDDLDCDPLELRPDSYQGIAGLLQSIRLGHTAVANPLGTGILENPALAAYMPALAKHFLGEDLQIRSPKTWWCGQKKGHDYVLANLDKLIIKRINQLHASPNSTIFGKFLSSKQRELLRDQIRSNPHWYIGTEELIRSSTPVLVSGRLEPRQLILRSFLVSGENGYVVMPGGLTRVASSPDSLASSLRSGGISKDTWVLASEAEKQVTLLTSSKPSLVVSEGQGELPSRVAENLFWLGRYAERSEGNIRLLRTVMMYLSDPFAFPNPQNPVCLHHLLRAVTHLTETFPGFVGEGALQRLKSPEQELLSVILDKNRVGSLSFSLQSMLNVAYSVRERLSLDMWRVITNLEDGLRTLQQQGAISLNDALSSLDNLVHSLAAFTGLSVENMTHEQGWRFLVIGRSLERAYHTANLLRATLCSATEDDAALLEHLLTITDSLLTYRRRYRSYLQINGALELILQSENNPRAMGFQLRRLESYIAAFHRQDVPYRTAEGRVILEMLTLVRLADMDKLAQVVEQFRPELDQLLVRLSRLLPELSDALTNAYFSHAEQPRQLVAVSPEVDSGL